MAPMRMRWVGKLEFLFTEIGYMVGLGNIWRFPHKSAVNGGGAIFIPYILTVVLCTFPVLFLEVFLGQYSSSGPIKVWDFCPIFKGVGWAMMFNVLVKDIYYSVLTMYAFYYMTVSFVNIGGELPWRSCSREHSWTTNRCNVQPFPDVAALSDSGKINAMMQNMDPTCVSSYKDGLNYTQFMTQFRHCINVVSPEEEYWNRYVLGVHEADGLDNIGGVGMRNAACLMLVWLFVFKSCLSGIRSIAKVKLADICLLYRTLDYHIL